MRIQWTTIGRNILSPITRVFKSLFGGRFKGTRNVPISFFRHSTKRRGITGGENSFSMVNTKLKSQPVLINYKPLLESNYKHEISSSIFPYEPIKSGNEISKRLSLFKHIILSNESVLILRNQIHEYRTKVANASSLKEVAAGSGTMLIATRGISFDKDAIFSIKEIRRYCRANGGNSNLEAPADLKAKDFTPLGQRIAEVTVIRMMAEKYQINSEEFENSMNLKDNHKNPYHKEFLENLADFANWIEGSLEILPHDLQAYINKL